MNGFYEKHRDELDTTHMKRGGSHLYPSHFHQNAEIYILKDGGYRISVNGEERNLTSGSILFIDSFDIHEYPDDSRCDDCVLIIPYHLMARFNSLRGNRRPTSPIITSTELVDRITYIIDTFLVDSDSAAVRDDATSLILSLLYEAMEFEGREDKSEASLIRSILFYIQDNYRTDISRDAVARALGYTPEHISRVFNKHLGRGLNDYINSLRLAYIEYRQTEADPPSITDLIYEAGFGSEQTYYRAKRKRGEVSRGERSEQGF